MNPREADIFAFDEFILDAEKRLLTRESGETVGLTPKVFELLLYLVRRAGVTLGKDELMSKIWTDSFVEENNLSQNISIIRKVLGEKRGEHRFIATVPGHGYKFVAKVREIPRTSPGEPETPTLSGQENADLTSRSWLTIAGGVAVIFALLAIGYYFVLQPARTEARRRSIAVLPFKPITSDTRDEALEMGIADTLIARLGDSPEMLVRPLASVRRFSSIDQDPLTAGQTLKVEAVLDGNIQRVGEKNRVNVRLIDVESGAALWSGTYDEEFTNIFSVQDRIAGKVADALKVRLGTTSIGRTANPEAYRLYLQGRYYLAEDHGSRGSSCVGVFPTGGKDQSQLCSCLCGNRGRLPVTAHK